jgi:hypothetical protein
MSCAVQARSSLNTAAARGNAGKDPQTSIGGRIAPELLEKSVAGASLSLQAWRKLNLLYFVIRSLFFILL